MICSICQNEYTGHGNNAQPVNEGRCCDTCNSVVIVARMNQMRRRTRKEEQPKPDMYEGPYPV